MVELTEVKAPNNQAAKFAIEQVQLSLRGVAPYVAELDAIEKRIEEANAELVALKQGNAAELERQKLARVELEQRYQKMQQWTGELEGKAAKLREEVIGLEGQARARREELQAIRAEREEIARKAGWA